MKTVCNGEPFFDRDFAESHATKSHWHLWLLVGSLCVNAAVMTYFFAEWNDGVLWFEVESRPRLEICSEAASPAGDLLGAELARLWQLPDQELLTSLGDTKTAANGYQVRELVLSLLELRGYQIQDPLRASGVWPLPKNRFSWKDGSGALHDVQLYSSLKDCHFASVERFCLTTEMPFTSEGIMARLASGAQNGRLKEALFRTDDWSIVRKLYPERSEEELFAIFRGLGSACFATIVSNAKAGVTPDALGMTMVQLFKDHPSPSLAEFIAGNYANFVVTQAGDEDIVQLLQVLPRSSPYGVRLAMRLLKAQRKTAVWNASQAFLSAEKGLQEIAEKDRDQALAFLQKMVQPALAQEAPVKEEKKPPQKETSKPTTSSIISSRLASRQLRPYRKYVVKKGDTLWSIAKKHNVDVEKLKYLNGLRGTDLTVGRELRIP